MKIITIPTKEVLEKLIHQAKKNDRIAQKQLYEMFASSMLAVCRRYISDEFYAEDVMIKGFFKVFTSLNQLKEIEKFSGFVKKIMINECIDYLRTEKKIHFEDKEIPDVIDENFELDFDIFELLEELPQGYKTVFNLYVIEEYKHKEIAEFLNISESTSKSQYFKAKKMIEKLLIKKNYKENEKSRIYK